MGDRLTPAPAAFMGALARRTRADTFIPQAAWLGATAGAAMPVDQPEERTDGEER